MRLRATVKKDEDVWVVTLWSERPEKGAGAFYFGQNVFTQWSRALDWAVWRVRPSA